MRRLAEIRKIQELVFELTVGDAKAQKAVTIPPTIMMSQVRGILKSNKIAAAPVVEHDALIGIVSVNDYINWLARKEPDCRVFEKMSRKVVFLYEDEPLVDAIKNFDRYGFYEFPVIERSSGRLTGIITRRDIILGLLKAMEIDYGKMELSSYSGRHFFNEMAADEIALTLTYDIAGNEIRRGGEAASSLKRNLGYLGIHPEITRRVAIAVYEAEMNLIIYGGGGRITVRMGAERIDITVQDTGPGIPDIARALQPGFSTAPDWVRELGFGAGMGFTNMQNCARRFDITSVVGTGTTLRMEFPLEWEPDGDRNWFPNGRSTQP
jgi:CBS domain-containing protein/anti-sigma regulatory factor (Ser/Thr protein kinase)